MASYKQIGENKYKIYVELGYDDNGKRIRKTKTVTAKSERALKKAITELEVEARETRDIYFENITFKKFYEEQFEPLYLDKLKVNTRNRYKMQKNYLIDFFGEMQLIKIKPLHIERFFDREQKNGRKSFSTKFSSLQSIFERAVEWEIIENNPVKKVKTKKSEKRKRKIQSYSEEQVRIIFKKLDEGASRKLSLQVKLAVLCGMRLGEIAGLTTDDIDLINNTITISKNLQYSKIERKIVIESTKTDQIRKIGIPKELYNEIKAYILSQKEFKLQMGELWKDSEYGIFLFTNEYGLPNNRENIQSQWRRFVQKIDLPYINFHGLRHTCATLLIKNGANINVVQDLLGHADIRMTINQYTHTTTDDIQKALEIFDKIF